MSETTEPELPHSDAGETPVWFWILAGLAILWNGFGVFDYIGTQAIPGYLDSFSEEQQVYFTSFPAAFVAVWATAVHLSLIASILLIVKMKLAELAFLVSIGLYIVNTVWSFGFMGAADMMGRPGVIMSVVIFATLVGFWWMARWANARGLLR